MPEIEVTQVSVHMQTIIRRLAEESQKAKGLIDSMATATQAYKKGRAVRSLVHKADGMAVTLIKHQAEGDASQLEAEMIVATQTLKAHFCKREDLRAQLNGYQSINKHLDNI